MTNLFPRRMPRANIEGREGIRFWVAIIYIHTNKRYWFELRIHSTLMFWMLSSIILVNIGQHENTRVVFHMVNIATQSSQNTACMTHWGYVGSNLKHKASSALRCQCQRCTWIPSKNGKSASRAATIFFQRITITADGIGGLAVATASTTKGTMQVAH